MGTKLFSLLLLSMPLVAGNIYGALREGKSTLVGVRVEIVHPQLPAPVFTQTEKDGSYRLFVRPNGRCTIRVFVGKEPAVAEVFSYDEPVKYDFEAVNQGGRYILQRR